jgi:putative addiction module antidote
MELKITKIRNSLGLLLPPELVTRLKLSEGDSFHVVERPSGTYLSAHPPHIEEQLRLGREFMAEYRETFEALAK